MKAKVERTSVKEKIDKIFLLPPSFHAVLSGALLGGVVNIITGLLFEKEVIYDLTLMVFGVIFLICSTIVFGYVSIVLEILREELHEKPEKEFHLTIHIKSQRKKLWSSFFAGILCALAGLLFIYAALR